MAEGVSKLRDILGTTQAVATILATVVTTIAAVFVPVIVAGIGNDYNESLKERDARLRTTELAIAVLQEDPKKAPEMPKLRDWAVDVVNAYSGVKIPEEAKKELQESRLVPQTQDVPFRDLLERHIAELYGEVSFRPISDDKKSLLTCPNLANPDAEKYLEGLDLETANLARNLILACRHYYNAFW